MAAANLSSRLHPKLRTIARNLPRVARANGFEVRVTSGYRSYATQAKLYRDYLAGVSHYPASPPGNSSHERGLALDIVSNNQEALVSLLTSVGLVWFGPGDPIHFSLPLGGSRTQKVQPVQVAPAKKKKSAAKKVLGVTSWIPGPVGWASMALDFLL